LIYFVQNQDYYFLSSQKLPRRFVKAHFQNSGHVIHMVFNVKNDTKSLGFIFSLLKLSPKISQPYFTGTEKTSYLFSFTIGGLFFLLKNFFYSSFKIKASDSSAKNLLICFCSSNERFSKIFKICACNLSWIFWWALLIFLPSSVK
jgi:hypothetical protein